MCPYGAGNTRHLQEPNFASSTATLGNIATAFYTGLWAYDGWNNLNYVTEEIKNPSKLVNDIFLFLLLWCFTFFL